MSRSLSIAASVLGLLIFMSPLASRAAYFHADLITDDADANMGTHIIVTGKGMEVGDQWLRAGHTQALLFKDRPHHGPIRFIGAMESAKSEGFLRAWGYSDIKISNRTFTGSRLNQELALVPRIASIDFIGHNGAILGFALENYDSRYFLDDMKALATLRKRMSPDAYVRIMGCNTGWNLAPAIAKALAVPTAGSFTFADIQQVHGSGNWFYEDARWPGGPFLERNEISFLNPVDCAHNGGCMRLKPVTINYQGKHGTYDGTIPFLKYFCGPVPETDCFRRMALSTQYLVGTTPVSDVRDFGQYKAAVVDHFCPSYKDLGKRAECGAQVGAILDGKRGISPGFSTSSGRTLTCNFQKCEFVTDCSKGICVLNGKKEKPSTTFVDEVRAYAKGFKSL